MGTYGLSIPIKRSSEKGLEHIKDNEPNKLAAQLLKTLLLTMPGEKVNDKDYGCGLYKYVLEYDTPIMRVEIENSIRQQVRKYLNFITISDISFESLDTVLYLTIIFGIGDNIQEITVPISQLEFRSQFE